MKLKEICYYLSFNEEEISEIESTMIINEKYYLDLFYKDENKFLKELSEKLKNDGMIALKLFLLLSIKLKNMYRKHKIDEKIFYDTIRDIKIWADEYKSEYGLLGIKEIFWINEHLRMRLFKLGRLQFQKKEIDENLKNYSINTKSGYVYYVHIPKDKQLLENEVEESYKLAQFFFKDEMVFVCESWLLSPKLKNILSSTSNIIKFSKNYHLLKYSNSKNSIYKYVKKDSKLYAKVMAYEEKNNEIIGESLGVYYYHKNK